MAPPVAPPVLRSVHNPRMKPDGVIAQKMLSPSERHMVAARGLGNRLVDLSDPLVVAKLSSQLVSRCEERAAVAHSCAARRRLKTEQGRQTRRASASSTSGESHGTLLVAPAAHEPSPTLTLKSTCGKGLAPSLNSVTHLSTRRRGGRAQAQQHHSTRREVSTKGQPPHRA